MDEIDARFTNMMNFQPGMVAIICVNRDGIPVYDKKAPDFDDTRLFAYAVGLARVASFAEITIADIDFDDRATLVRVRTKRHEIMVFIDFDYYIVTIQKLRKFLTDDRYLFYESGNFTRNFDEYEGYSDDITTFEVDNDGNIIGPANIPHNEPLNQKAELSEDQYSQFSHEDITSEHETDSEIVKDDRFNPKIIDKDMDTLDINTTTNIEMGLKEDVSIETNKS